MPTKKDLLELPLLITRELIVFPGITQPIEAGRPISVNAIETSRDETDSLIFVTAQKDSSIDDPKEKDVYEIGCLCRVTTIMEQGKSLKIRINPTDRVKFENVYFDESKKIYIAKGVLLDYKKSTIEDDNKLRDSILKKMDKTPDIYRILPKAYTQSFDTKPFTLIAYELIHSLSNSNKNRQKALEENDKEKLFNIVSDAINGYRLSMEIDSKATETVTKNAERAQKEYFINEKIKALKKELDNGDGDLSGTDKMLDELEKHPYPEHVKAKVKTEIKRFEMMPQASLEASLIQNYLDTIMTVPWYQKTEDNEDLNNVEKILDEDHYGLDKVKKRIVEYLAVKKLTNSLKSPILCFFGPPGCGKTSLGRSIARALGRKFVKASLGGISDEAEIRGHRRTYVGSMPGRIIAGMRKAGVNNPVFLLDEIDKLASSYKGDPASAMLEVLDPEQNFAFTDNYLEEPMDLSDVLFICTANYLENIPGPLRDRLELIEVSSYTEIEKLHIAKDHLIKKQIEINGIDPNKVEFTDESIFFIIQHYTREAGVRDLERKIAGCLRKIAVNFVKKPDSEKVIIDNKKVVKYLGTEIFENSKKEVNEQIGVVTGLAYTDFGGDILPIEVNDFPGTGRLVVTGSLGDVMKESCSIALDFVRANASKYGIDDEVFKKNDIHIHVPEGAVKKDGPSAGVAITTAIISCLSKTPVDPNVAMTGEVTLRGFALPIGGLREKSLAALRSGIKTIIVPNENKKDVNELPKEVKEALKIIFMKNVDDAIKVALIKKE